MKKLCVLLLIVVSPLLLCEGGRIMFYMPLVSTSMKITFMPLAEELGKRGHEVVIFMPMSHKDKLKNVEVAVVDSKFDELQINISKTFLETGASSTPPIFDLLDAAIETNDNLLGHPRMKQLLSDPETKFDILMVSPFFASESGYYLAHKFNASLVMYFTGQASISFLDHALGMPHNPAFVPFLMLQYNHPMTFFQRVVNTIATLFFQYVVRDYYVLSRGEALLDKHFPGEARRSLLQMEKDVRLIIHYGHPLIMDGNRPVAPNYQYIGMMNCRPPKKLPENLQAFMDSGSEHGVIYVSFGSVLKASQMSEDKRKLLLSVFSKLKQKVIWKWETEEMDNLPPNVKLSKWLPQQEILAHPNLKVFVTHSGQSSIQETLCHQKPVVAVPVLGDQPANAREAERQGFGVAVEFQQLTEERLMDALTKVLTDPSYAHRAREHGSLLTDQITQPLDRAVWWLEWLLRHSDKNYLRSPVHDLAWYEYFLLDVFSFFLICVLLVIFIVIKACRLICGRKKGQLDRRMSAKKKN